MQFARLLLVAASIVFAGLMPARATPMLLVDMETLEVLYEQEAGQPWHPASLTKLMTAYVTFEKIDEGRIALDTVITMSKAAVSQAPSSSGLKPGSSITLKDALYVLVVHSANDIAWAIAEAVGGSEPEFVDMMNEAAARMGLGATHFTNPNGLHDSEQVTSARDIAVLALYLRQSFPQYLPIFETEVVTLGKANMKTNNNLLTHFAGTTGMKTGFVCASGLNIVATIDRGGRSLMAVVLGGSSARERGEMTAGLFLRALSGALAGTGKNIVQVANQQVAPVDMRPLLCGKGAKAYVAQREAEFPLGLDGQPSNLTDDVNGLSYAATDLGVIVKGVPLPRPRPDHARGTMQQAIVEIGPNSIEAIGPNSVESIASDMVETIGPNSVTTPTPVVIGVTPDGAPVPYPRPRPRPRLQQG